MRNNPKSTRVQETDTRFERARRHLVRRDRLVAKVDETAAALLDWKMYDAQGRLLSRNGRGPIPWRKPRTPEERAELKKLENANLDARANLLVFDNDGGEI